MESLKYVFAYSPPDAVRRSSHADTVTHIAHAHPVVVFARPGCPYCQRALARFNRWYAKWFNDVDPKANEDFKIRVVDVNDHAELKKAHAQLTGAATVPRIWVGGRCVGGNSDTEDESSMKTQVSTAIFNARSRRFNSLVKGYLYPAKNAMHQLHAADTAPALQKTFAAKVRMNCK